MRINDSKFALCALLLSLTLLNGCTSTEITQSAFVRDTNLDGEYDKQANPLVASFNQTCLSGLESPLEISDLASANGWQAAKEDDLDKAGLTPLRKLVLEIPGGGGRFSEEQYLYARPSLEGYDILNIERRFAKQETLATQCDAYGLYDYLQNCEALGKLLNRAPDYNQSYNNNGSHFIRWNIVLNGKSAVVSCDKAAANSSAKTTDNLTKGEPIISLSLKIDHGETGKPAALGHPKKMLSEK